jgi:hypothetical protein
MILKKGFDGLNQAITRLLSHVVADIGELDASIVRKSIPPDREHWSKTRVFHSPKQKRRKIS